MAINPEKICFARSDPHFHEVVTDADVHICDGIGTAVAVRILCGLRIPRITGVELFLEIVAAAEEEDLSIFLLGATPTTNEAAFRKLSEMYPRLRIVGRQDGYVCADRAQSVVEAINSAQADILFVALGSPKQEQWIARHRAQLQVPFCMGVGGSFDIVSGRIKRAPAFFRRTGTEWLYRLVSEPRRWRRQCALPKFAFSVLVGKFRPEAAPKARSNARTL